MSVTGPSRSWELGQEGKPGLPHRWQELNPLCLPGCALLKEAEMNGKQSEDSNPHTLVCMGQSILTCVLTARLNTYPTVDFLIEGKINYFGWNICKLFIQLGGFQTYHNVTVLLLKKDTVIKQHRISLIVFPS